ncbi:MAG: L-lactate permease [Ilumatobacteraceae bacterium]
MPDDLDEVTVPVDVWHWSLAVAPLVVLVVLLVVRRWTAAQAAPVGLAIAVVVALTAFGSPIETIAVASGKGVWDGVFILAVVWPALLLYRVTDRAGAQAAIRHGLAAFSRNRLFLIMGFGWVFASFLQGITGFGAPIAVVAPLLVSMGVRPVLAVVIPLVGHAWANLFGTLGVAWLGTQQVIDLDDPDATALTTATMLLVPVVASGLTIAWLVGRGRGVVHALPLIGTIALIHGGGQVLIASFEPVLAAFVPATLALVALYPLSFWRRYSDPAHDVDVGRVMVDDDPDREAADQEAADQETDGRRDRAGTDEREPSMGLGLALVPYAALTVVALVSIAIGPVRDALESVEVAPSFPATTTAEGVTQDATDAYSPVTPLTHPGLYLLIGAVVAAVAFRRAGAFAERRSVGEDRPSLGAEVVSDAVPASVAVVLFLVLSAVFEHAGQVTTLAAGIERVAPGSVYVVLASSVGALGSFMTSSNTSSNVLFAPLQQAVATAQELSEPVVIGAQHVGGAIGNSVAPANVALGTGTAGISGREGEVLRRTAPFAAVTALAVGVVALVMELAS